ncbi:MAG: hypothetical protein GXP52_05670 [Deltaproteobacteria bacterium]|nr:hypothetical protein [Deltaproteobacteria bacterium]
MSRGEDRTPFDPADGGTSDKCKACHRACPAIARRATAEAETMRSDLVWRPWGAAAKILI